MKLNNLQIRIISKRHYILNLKPLEVSKIMRMEAKIKQVTQKSVYRKSRCNPVHYPEAIKHHTDLMGERTCSSPKNK